MIKKILGKAPNAKARSTVYVVAGMGAIMTGQKSTGLGLFARGFYGLEKAWRQDHPEFEGGLGERWNEALVFYESTHEDETNRMLHMVGIPMIVGGAVGLLAFKPHQRSWKIAAGLFGAGWGLNIIGHAIYEGKAPAFADDPLSFVAGPVWDVMQMRGEKKSAPDAAPAPAQVPVAEAA